MKFSPLVILASVLANQHSVSDALSLETTKCSNIVHRNEVSRRGWIGEVVSATIVASSTLMTWSSCPQTSEASGLSSDYVKELQDSQSKLQEIPSLLQDQEWDKVRTILKTPPVNKLWNLGDSQNTVLKLAKETGNVDLFELKDDLAYNLQMCDQLTYDNVFVYFQPGNGKIKIKEPTDFATKALKQLDDIIREASNN
jgi:hypothetical protein